jgi:hypothetical protein
MKKVWPVILAWFCVVPSSEWLVHFKMTPAVIRVVVRKFLFIIGHGGLCHRVVLSLRELSAGLSKIPSLPTSMARCGLMSTQIFGSEQYFSDDLKM